MEAVKKKTDQNVEKYVFEETMSALDHFLQEHRNLGVGTLDTLPANKVLPDALYIEKKSDEAWKHVQSLVSEHVRYEIVETGRPVESFPYPYDFPYQVREWHEIDTNQWAYSGEGIFCKTLEQANDYIATQEGRALRGNIVQITKLDENIRKVSQKNDKDRLFIKKYDMWWSAYENDRGEINPTISAIGSDHELIHNYLKRMLTDLKRSGIKEIDFSHWSFTDVRFDKSMMELMKFADKINFRNASFCYGNFYSVELKNVDFSGASFDMYGIVDCTFRKCDFSRTAWEEPAMGDNGNLIKDSTFIGCNFKDVKFDNAKFSNNKFTRTNIDKYLYGPVNKPSVLRKLNELKQSVAKNTKERVSAERDVKQHDRRQEER
ncbi:hypothetical protein D7V90_11885 [bacterium 1xD42-87]|nr:hypothetical protein D7V90_11885 [bacterium 1xD42-87]